MQIVISSTSVDQNWFVRNHIKRLKHYALYLILLKYKIYILGRTQMSIIVVTMPHNFGRGFIIITFIYAKNILAKVSRVLSLDNLVFKFFWHVLFHYRCNCSFEVTVLGIAVFKTVKRCPIGLLQVMDEHSTLIRARSSLFYLAISILVNFFISGCGCSKTARWSVVAMGGKMAAELNISHMFVYILSNILLLRVGLLTI